MLVQSGGTVEGEVVKCELSWRLMKNPKNLHLSSLEDYYPEHPIVFCDCSNNKSWIGNPLQFKKFFTT